MLSPLKIILCVFFAFIAGCANQPEEPVESSILVYLIKPNANHTADRAALLTDSNRDGKINSADFYQDNWSWQGRGAFVAANVDDDDQDGIRDCEDDSVNGHSDESDLTELLIDTKSVSFARAHSVSLTTGTAAAQVKLFFFSDQKWHPAGRQIKLSDVPQNKDGYARIAIEACEFASNQWDGFLKVVLSNSDGGALQDVTLRMAPFLMLPNTARMESFYISADLSGRYDNKKMLSELTIPMLLNGISLRVHQTDAWQEMWMQDTMEIGYSETPTSRMHVVLNAPRGKDRVGPTLLGANVGFITVAQPRPELDSGDQWIDWFGNLEVSPPSELFPHGRIYYGHNPETGNSLHPDVVGFLEAQQLQSPIALDSGWLFIKHVDEMLTYWPSRTADRYVAVLPSPRLAAEILGTELDENNAKIQKRFDEIIHGDENNPPLHKVFGLKRDQILLQPLLYDAGTFGATGRWSNPVNSVAIDSAVIYGRTDLPEQVHSYIRSTITELRLFPLSVDDSAYQPRFGNVHCASNSKRSLPRARFWLSR